MREKIVFYLNGVRHEIGPDLVHMTLAEYLRYQKGLTGTKIVCAEGDCGACSVVMARFHESSSDELHYTPINSCIAFLYLLDLCHIVTVEGLGDEKNLHPVQQAMVEAHGAQCGYCTPGFICAMASLCDEIKHKGKSLNEQKVKNGLTGNLCRCTGYEPIIKAAMQVGFEKYQTLTERYHSKPMLSEFAQLAQKSVHVNSSKFSVHLPNNKDELLSLQAKKKSKIVSGATDLGVLSNKNKLKLTDVISLINISECYDVVEKKDHYFVGARANLHKVERSLVKDFPEFSRMIHIFASPQIKNKATLVGNIANGSPIGDSIPFLFVAKASLVIEKKGSSREVLVEDFYKGYKQFDLDPEEIIWGVKIPKRKLKFKLFKVSTRKDLDISAVTFAMSFTKADKEGIKDLTLAYGGVGPIVKRVIGTEKIIEAQAINAQLVDQAHKILETEIAPISDHRGSSDFRHTLAKNLLSKALDEVLKGEVL